MVRLYKRWRTAPRVTRSALTDREREAIARRVVEAFPLRPGMGMTQKQVNRPALAAIALFVAEQKDQGASHKELRKRFDPKDAMHPQSRSATVERWVKKLREAGILELEGHGATAIWFYRSPDA